MLFNKEKIPFSSFFSICDPKTFVLLLKDESLVIIYFILTFCKSKSYIKKVLNLNGKLKEFALTYFDENNNIEYNKFVTDIIENYCNELIKDYKEDPDQYKPRKIIHL